MHVAATAAPSGAVPVRGAPAAAAAPRPPPRATPPRASSRAAAASPHAAQPARSAATAAAAAAAPPGLAEPCPISATAFATALDAGAGLPDSWLSYWRQQEAKREARRALIGSTRGRQQQRLRQVATLLTNGSLDLSSGSSSSSSVAAAGLPLRPSSSSNDSSSSSSSSSLEAAEELLLSNGGELDGGSMDLPPLQQMSELDELTWLASHPPDSEGASSSSSSGSGGGGSYSGGDDSSSMQLWAGQSEQQLAQQAQQDQRAQRHPGHIVGLAGSAAEGRSAAELQGPLQLRVGSDLLSVRPLWIAVYQPEEGGPAKLFESVSPLLPDLIGRLSADIAPFCSVSGLKFVPADAAAGPWRNYFVGLVGAVAADEDDILWPNQVLHRDRVLFNVRNGWDVAKFLSEPQKEDVEQHRDNLLRLAAERGYRRGWCWHMLHLRWGEATLRSMGLNEKL
ncbi:hypothetical protein C2E21_7814 [Chlorella sorokiniana]|uniref:Uncharacterized protein n=1 Tax=Chlorella sorokiniana TaxID=3076 RepID=A0A2P6TGC1_CHLSO|nr:hypothetical protein C2E21_7814 [Chlorella sorokiniana]|eukprot:PRW33168.1 hypothetical protein C2E21_7814 [Chlorella sorokiniana]